MDGVLDNLGGLKEQRLEEYHRLISRVLGGEEIAASEIEMACVLAGEDPGDFARTVRRRQERAKERERHATLPAVRQQLAGLDAEIAANHEKFEAARLAHDQECWRLAPLRDSLIGDLQSLNGIEQSLIQGCGDESLVGRTRSLEIYLESNRRQHSEAVRNLHLQQSVLRQHSDATLERWWIDRNAQSPPLPVEVADDAPFAEWKRRVLRAQAVIDDLNEKASQYRTEIDQNQRDRFEW